MNEKLEKWNDAYQEADIASAKPAHVLQENTHLLPENGAALDLACGRAGNAIYLSKLGFKVDAVDISPVVLSHVKLYAQQTNLTIDCETRDIEKSSLNAEKKYDVIVVSYFLNRDLFPQIMSALKPNGIMFYETWSQEKIENAGPSNPDFRLEKGELLRLTKNLETLFYREESQQGDTSKGTRNIAMIVAKSTC